MSNCTTAAIDAHVKTCRVCVIRGDELLDERTLPTDAKRIAAWMREHRVARVCYEAGPIGFGLARQLHELGEPCEVIAPSLIPVLPGDRIKTDARDARKLARMYQGGLLTAVYIPPAHTEAIRELVRVRDDARLDRTRARHRIGKFLMREGRTMPTTFWGPTRREWLQRQRFDHPAHTAAYDDYLTTLELADRRIEKIELSMAEAARHPSVRDQVERLMTIRGVGIITALGIVVEVGSLDRFASASKFMSYVGLVPSEHSSGGDRKQGAITRAGNKHLRRLLVEAAWNNRSRPSVSRSLVQRHAGQDPRIIDHAMRCQARLHRRWQRMQAKGKPHNKIVCAVARELAGFIWAIGTNQPLRPA
jgi:transposase